MNGSMLPAFGSLAVVLTGAIVLVVCIVVLTRLSRVLPVRPARRRAIERWTPIVGSALGVGYLVWAVTRLFRGRDEAALVVLLLLSAVLLASSWLPLRDIVGGVYWRMTRPWRAGDPIEVGGAQGRIARLGYRVVAVETERAELVLIPYTVLLREPVALHGMAAGDLPHEFRLRLPPGVTFETAEVALKRALVLCYGASVLRPPRLRLVDGDGVQVTVFLLSRAFASAVEVRAREELRELSGSADGPSRSG